VAKPTIKPTQAVAPTATVQAQNCDPAYPDFCIPPPPPDLNCKDVLPHVNFRVLPPDPHKFDRDGNGIGCEK
jgi:micrococcal nuclease